MSLFIISKPFEFHIAPMQGYSDAHFRYYCRLLSPRSVLWSEMLKPNDLFNGNEEMLLTRGYEYELSNKLNGNDLSQCVMQLGDNNVDNLIRCVKLINSYPYTQIDLNCGCPAIETSANYGANLMKDPNHVAYLVDKMNDVSNIPISVKCRIGVHDNYNSNTNNIDDYNTLRSFVETVSKSGSVKKIVIHARSAVLQGLSPTKNREIPPLRHDYVQQIAQEFNHLHVVINGGFNKLDDVSLYKNDKYLSGMMSGRWMLQNIYDLYNIDKMLYNTSYYYRTTEMTMKTSIQLYCEYADKMMSLYKKDQYPSILLPIAIMADSLLYHHHDDHIAKELGITLIESSLPLLSKAGYDINYNTIYNDNDDDDDLIPGFDRFRKYLVKALGKKIVSKLRSNIDETVRIN